MKRLLLVHLCLLPLLAGPLLARVPDNLQAIQREARIVADVIKSALRQEGGDSLRVSSVEAQYLADQGVLLTVNLNTPWLGMEDRGEAWNYGRIAIPEIPQMVEDILNDLQINIPPYEPEALEELRDLRGEQRSLRQEQRKIRAELRKQRREMARSDDADKRRDLAEEIRDSEAELEELDHQYDDLARDIDLQYQQLRNYQEGGPPPANAPAPDMDVLIARTACDYGGTLNSLHEQQYLTISLRRGQSLKFYAFKMQHINQCSRRNIQPEQLLRDSFQYEG